MNNKKNSDRLSGKAGVVKIISVILIAWLTALGAGCMNSVSMMPKDSYETVSKGGNDYNPKFERKLIKDVQFLDVTFPAGSRLKVGDGEWWMTISKSVKIDGVEIPAGSQVSFSDKASDVPYIAIFQYKVFKSARLQLEGAQLGGDFKIADLKFNKGSTVWFKKDRDVVGFLQVKVGPIRVSSARLSGVHSFGNSKYADDSDVWFNRLGEVTSSRTKEERIAQQRAWAQRVQACRRSCAPWSGDNYQFQNCKDRCLGR